MSKVVKDNNFELKPPIVYKPQHTKNELVRYKKFVEDKYKINLKDYWELHEWSCKNFPEFWDCLWRFYDIKYSEPYTEVFNRKSSFDNAEWFKGLRFNYAENIFKYRDSHTALIAADVDGDKRFVTYRELYDEVRVYVKALKNTGIHKGDVVACYMTNKIEAVFAFLATSSIGAIWHGTLPSMGIKLALWRLQQIKPKILFTTGNFFFEDKEYRMDLKVPAIVEGLKSLKKVVFVPTKSKAKKENITGIPKCVFIMDFLEQARNAVRYDTRDLEFEQVPFEHPLYITFTSGTTGGSKGLIHSTGTFLASLKDFGLHQDCTRDDVLFCFCPCGWVVWNMFINTLHLGLTVVVYEGNPCEKKPTQFWDVVDQFGLTSYCMPPEVLEMLETKGSNPTSKHSLKTLKQLLPIGSSTKPQVFQYVSEIVKPNLFCSPLYGCAEVFSSISGLDTNLPVYKGEMQVISLGMDIHTLDEKDLPVRGKRGNLVLANPYPALPIAIVNDENKEIIRDQYLTKHPGYWNIAEYALINPATNGLIVYGRNDETMNPMGERFNGKEIYLALEGFTGLSDSVCVPHYNSNMANRAVLFVKMLPDYSFTPDVEKEIRMTIIHHLSDEYEPSVITETPDIPYNLAGKKLNVLVKKLINKWPVENEEIVKNPLSIEFFKTVELGQF